VDGEGSSYWDNNLRIIRERYPGLAERLGKSSGGDFAEALRVEAAASGDPTLIIRDIHIHSPRDPVREGRRLAQTLRGGGPVIVLGFGLGYAAEAAAEKAEILVVVERRPELLRRALEIRDLRNWLERRLIFVLGGESGGVGGALELLEGPGVSPEILRNRGLIGLDASWYAGVEEQIRTWVSRDDVNTATLRRFGKRWVRNLAINMEAIRDLPGISRLNGILAGTEIPVFLAAAGPSLDASVPWLARIRERCVVVAVDTSLGRLLGAGVEPDFAVVVDPQYWNARHLDRCRAPRTSLIAESAVYPGVLRDFLAGGQGAAFRRAFLCSSLFPLGRFIENRLDPKGVLGAGGSVSTTAWDFARSLGSPFLWIAGLDLSFPGLKTHFSGALFEERALHRCCRFIPAETHSVRSLRDGLPFKAPAADGGQVLTDRRLSLYAAWFESHFRRYPEIQNRSLAASSLAIPGLPYAPVGELLALPPRRKEIDRLLENVFSSLEAAFSGDREKRAEQYRKARETLLEGLERIRSVAEKAALLAEQGEAACRGGRPAAASILRKLDNANRTITDSEVKDVAGFLFPPMAELEAALKSPPSDPLRRHLELSAGLYRSLENAAAYHIRVLSNSLKIQKQGADTENNGG
jgi:hypothetical protein